MLVCDTLYVLPLISAGTWRPCSNTDPVTVLLEARNNPSGKSLLERIVGRELDGSTAATPCELLDIPFTVFHFVGDYGLPDRTKRSRNHSARSSQPVSLIAAGNADNHVRDHVIVFDKLIAAPLDQQFDQVERCPLVAVRKPVVADNGVTPVPPPFDEYTGDNRGKGEQSLPESRARSRSRGLRHTEALPHGHGPHPAR